MLLGLGAVFPSQRQVAGKCVVDRGRPPASQRVVLLPHRGELATTGTTRNEPNHQRVLQRAVHRADAG